MKTLNKICRNLFGHATVPRDTFAAVPVKPPIPKKKKKKRALTDLTSIFPGNI